MTSALSIADWQKENKPRDGLYYKKGQGEQIIFVRDTLVGLFANAYEESQLLQNDGLKVISSHSSKSVPLPVFKLELPDGTFFVLRYNFYNWIVSVSSPNGVYMDFMGLVDHTAETSSVYCEGFPEELVFGSYSSNQKQFTISLSGGNYQLYTFFYLFARWWKANK